MTTPVKLSGFVDATKLFEAACDALPLGTMVHPPGFTMMDTMGAVEAMESRTDTGMQMQEEDLPPEDRLSQSFPRAPFSPQDDARSYTLRDVCFIMDRLLACDVAFQSGSFLSLSIYTCLWLHENPGALAGHDPENGLLQALQAYVSAVARCTSVIWTELVKMNVYDMEDFQGDLAGLRMLDTYSLPSDAYIAQLDAACDLLNEQEKHALLPRLRLRRNILLCVELLADTPTSDTRAYAIAGRETLTGLSQASASSDSLNRFLSPHLRDAPNLCPARAFDISIHRRLASNVPGQPKALPNGQDISQFYQIWFEGVTRTVEFLEKPGWEHWSQSLRFDCDGLRPFGSQLQHCSYIRSLTQSLMCGGKNANLDWLVYTYIEETTGLSFRDVQTCLGRIRQLEAAQARAEGRLVDSNGVVQGGANSQVHAIMPTSEKISWILQRLASLLANYLCTLCQNRARQRRNLSKAYRNWAELGDSLAQISAEVMQVDAVCGETLETIFACVQGTTFDLMLQIVFLGFSLELISKKELVSTYWLASFLALEKESLLSETLKHVPSNHPCSQFLMRQLALARALTQSSDVAYSLSLVVQAKKPDPDRFSAVAQARFMRRFKWIDTSTPSGVPPPLEMLWQRFCDNASLAEKTFQGQKHQDLLSRIASAVPSAEQLSSPSAGPLQRVGMHISKRLSEYEQILKAQADVDRVRLYFASGAWFPSIQIV